MEFFSPNAISSFVQTAGYLGLFAIVFTETGFLFGVFLPGDSLLFTAGFLASQGYFSFPLIVLITFSAAVLGDNTNYYLGKKWGSRIFNKEKSLFFDKQHIERSKVFYAEHGGKTIIFARFIPIIRSVAPALAGVGHMPYSLFLAYSIFGGALWTGSLTSIGYFLGKTFPESQDYFIVIILCIVGVSLLPSLLQFARKKNAFTVITDFLDSFFKKFPLFRKILGILFIGYGVLALFTPFTPGSWLIFIGFELVGIEILFLQKIKAWLSRRKQ